MENTHFFALIILFILFGAGILFKKLVIDITIIIYDIILAYIAITESWEILFFPILISIVLIELILGWKHASKGDLL